MEDTGENVDRSWVQFAEAVKALREAQKLYFKTRKKDDLIAAKRLEASIDVVWLPQILESRRKDGEGVTSDSGEALRGATDKAPPESQ